MGCLRDGRRDRHVVSLSRTRRSRRCASCPWVDLPTELSSGPRAARPVVQDPTRPLVARGPPKLGFKRGRAGPPSARSDVSMAPTGFDVPRSEWLVGGGHPLLRRAAGTASRTRWWRVCPARGGHEGGGEFALPGDGGRDGRTFIAGEEVSSRASRLGTQPRCAGKCDAIVKPPPGAGGSGMGWVRLVRTRPDQRGPLERVGDDAPGAVEPGTVEPSRPRRRARA